MNYSVLFVGLMMLIIPTAASAQQMIGVMTGSACRASGGVPDSTVTSQANLDPRPEMLAILWRQSVRENATAASTGSMRVRSGPLLYDCAIERRGYMTQDKRLAS
jgi:hypothetical protein